MYINVQVIDMDAKIIEQVRQNDDDGYTIFLNARHSQEQRARSYQHAMEHIRNDDFSRTDVQEIENAAHKIG